MGTKSVAGVWCGQSVPKVQQRAYRGCATRCRYTALLYATSSTCFRPTTLLHSTSLRVSAAPRSSTLLPCAFPPHLCHATCLYRYSCTRFRYAASLYPTQDFCHNTPHMVVRHQGRECSTGV